MSFNTDIKISIIRTNRRTLSVQLRNGEILARAPLRMKDKEIYSFIESKKAWIEKNLAKLDQRQRVASRTKPLTKEEINALTQKAKEIIPERVRFYAPQIGVTYNRITIRCQKTRWGSCSSKGNLRVTSIIRTRPKA